jgi:hypothetical protein
MVGMVQAKINAKCVAGRAIAVHACAPSFLFDWVNLRNETAAGVRPFFKSAPSLRAKLTVVATTDLTHFSRLATDLHSEAFFFAISMNGDR